MILTSVILIITGFVLLAKGAEILVSGASDLARHCHMSDLMIGFTVVALGTSAPELTVSVMSALKGSGGIALGNVMGSNIANMGLVLGLAGLLAPIAVARSTIARQVPFCLLTSLALFGVVACFNTPFLISRIEACLLLAGAIAYILLTIAEARQQPSSSETSAVSRKLWISLVMLGGGLAGLILGGEMIVRNSVLLARRFGLSDQMIGVTIIAFGTSLPEIATSITAVLHGKPDMAVGNVVGSNILNICLVLGCAGIIRPFDAGQPCIADAAFVVAATLLLLLFMFTGNKRKLDRWEAALFLAMYVVYIAIAVLRG